MRSPEFKLVSRQGLEWLECTRLGRMSWLVHAFGTRRGGVSKRLAKDPNLRNSQSDLFQGVKANAPRFFTALGVSRFHLASLRQIHSAQVYLVAKGSAGKLQYRPAGSAASPKLAAGPEPQASSGQAGDALLTDQASILLSVRTADCVPVLLADSKRRVVAVAHAGWRGALERCVEKTVGEMRRLFGTCPSDLVAAIGPSIRVCCYEVGEEVQDEFRSRFSGGEKFFQKVERALGTIGERHPLLSLTDQPLARIQSNPPAIHLDLVAVTRAQLRSAGVPPDNVEVAEFCTACRIDLFFSHRKEGNSAGRMVSVIGIRP